MAEQNLKIIGFLCNWCSYAGADMAGMARMKQPADLRVVRMPCTGRVNPLLVLKAFQEGADGVLVSGCHPGDCHYTDGNYYARRRLELLARMLPALGIEPERFHYTWVSASEGARWTQVVEEFTEQVQSVSSGREAE
ncbi:MAG: hydrogenase iron-sulfur subunit [Thermoleophilia bacterium]|nr:hydrogenase iron-sulfur subunit [Thermoleophilia bacterium]